MKTYLHLIILKYETTIQTNSDLHFFVICDNHKDVPRFYLDI